MQKNINSSLHISYGERLIWLNFPVHKNPGIWCPMCLEHDCLGKKAWLGTQEVLPTTCLCLKLQRASQSLADMQNVWERAALARADKEDWLDTRQSDWVSYGTRLPKEQNPLLTALASDTPAAVRLVTAPHGQSPLRRVLLNHKWHERRGHIYFAISLASRKMYGI